MKKQDFNHLAEWIRTWDEMFFYHKWKLYSIIHWENWDIYQPNDKNSYFYFIVWPKDYNKEVLTDVYKETYRVCLSSETEKFISWLADFKIDWITVKEIFDKWLYEYLK